MPIDVKALEGALAESLKAEMIPPDLAEEFKPDAEKGVADMAKGQIEGIAPFIEAFNELELRLDALENEVIPQLEEQMGAGGGAGGGGGGTSFSAGDFNDLTDRITGLEGDVNDLKTQAGTSTGTPP